MDKKLRMTPTKRKQKCWGMLLGMQSLPF